MKYVNGANGLDGANSLARKCVTACLIDQFTDE